MYLVGSVLTSCTPRISRFYGVTPTATVQFVLASSSNCEATPSTLATSCSRLLGSYTSTFLEVQPGSALNLPEKADRWADPPLRRLLKAMPKHLRAIQAQP